MAVLIVAGVLILLNAVFLIGSFIFTMSVSKGKDDPRLSTLGSVLDNRMGLQPQVVFYEAMVRLSGIPSLSQQQFAEMTENQTKRAA